MEVKIPKSFTLLGREYKVLQPNKVVVNGESYLGHCDSDSAVIKIRKNLKKELKEHTFLHEATHAILFSLGYDDLSYDEKLVDLFSGALHQILKTAKYEDKTTK